MKKVLLILSLVVLFAIPSMQAQYAEAKHAIGIRYIGANYQLPITDNLRDDDFTYGMEIEYTGYLADYLNIAVPFKIHKAELPRDEMGDVRSSAALSLDALLQLQYFKEPAFVNPYIFAGLGAINEDLEDFTFAAPVGLGFNFRLGKHAYLSTKAEYRFGFDDLRDNLQLGAGIKIILGEGVKDADKDGIPDEEDACPMTPGLPAYNGCPDTDGDGLADPQDECPTEAGPANLKGCPDKDGDGLADKNDKCPDEAGPMNNDGCPILDADGDGVLDEDDECPSVPGLAATKGCPDTDGDGIADKNDKCPGQAGLAQFDGCPDTDSDGIPDGDDKCPKVAGLAEFDGCPDTDGDGIIDSQDACPTLAGVPEFRGCPEITAKEKEVLEFATQAIQFETGKSSFKTESYPILDQIVEILKKYEGYNVKIEGHTDSVGSAETNQKLSDDRAQACYDYFRGKGISSSRMTSQGFGEDKPIANNKYKSGRDKNRRVEFDVFLKDQ
ncbi:MAG: OmpA family protein [Bacteroidota bacterium]